MNLKIKDTKDGMLCPVCKDVVCIPAEGVSKLRTNDFIEKLISAQKVSDSELRKTGDFCEQHPTKSLEFYCRDSRLAICNTCVLAEHNGHMFEDFMKFVGDFKSSMAQECEGVSAMITCIENQSKKLSGQMRSFTKSVSEKRCEVLERGEALKRLVDEHVRYLLTMLDEYESKTLRGMELTEDQLLKQLISFESFRKYCHLVIEEATPAEVAKIAEDIKVVADELKIEPNVQFREPPEITFIPVDIDRIIPDKVSFTNNIVGSISGKHTISSVQIINSNCYCYCNCNCINVPKAQPRFKSWVSESSEARIEGAQRPRFEGEARIEGEAQERAEEMHGGRAR